MKAENLLCNELWLSMMTPTPGQVEEELLVHPNGNNGFTAASSYSNAEDCEEVFRVFLRKEMTTYALESDYLEHVRENFWVNKARVKAINWFVKSQRRLNLSLETLFDAANYFDRFSSLNKYQVCNDWMIELLSVACLSTAAKLNETSPPSLYQIQMEGVENLFESSLIQRMELNMLETLEWRLRPATSYSYFELLTKSSINNLLKFNQKQHFGPEFEERVIELLGGALLDSKFLEFRPSVIAMSALQHISDELGSARDGQNSVCMARFRALIASPDQQEKLIKCHEMMTMMMEENSVDTNCKNCDDPSSPVTVLANNTQCCCDFGRDCQAADDSLFKTKKRRIG
ncbi:OLC1v1034909C1 [Oldenlandia corymbosa var. corymbosa]|uniref:OLC1v1034909C1 n=1 Tax=Oldenlandia corymbosa var. corymbosa TaxID=529605 RepID=A0AAV1CT09_OLDCO|nr:OLC1v1034909C1 [Oldenlandia corymbosa var. corymbosa]